MIKDHSIFKNLSRNPQAPVALQLLVTIQWLDCDGNGVSTGRVSRLTGIAEGSVVHKSCVSSFIFYEERGNLLAWFKWKSYYQFKVC
jgi:hypothetical protein